MNQKQTTGLVPGKHGTPWTYIDEVAKTQNEKYESLLENLIELSGRVTDILTLMESQGNKLKALEAVAKKPVKKAPAKKNV